MKMIFPGRNGQKFTCWSRQMMEENIGFMDMWGQEQAFNPPLAIPMNQKFYLKIYYDIYIND